jgi:hypothetical protein
MIGLRFFRVYISKKTFRGKNSWFLPGQRHKMERPKRKATINDAATGFFHVQNSCNESRNPGGKYGRHVMKETRRISLMTI